MSYDLFALLSTLITEWENEVIEFKQAGADYKTDRMGALSALVNGAFRGEV
jgi:ATP-dependent DNA helicase RecG